MSTQQQIKIAVIGAGNWGRQHARIFAARPDVHLCAVVGRTRERTEARAAEFGTRAYLDIDKMLEREQHWLEDGEQAAAVVSVVVAAIVVPVFLM